MGSNKVRRDGWVMGWGRLRGGIKESGKRGE